MLEKYLQKIPGAFQGPVLAAWNAIQDVYAVDQHNMPVPEWRTRGYDETGDFIWQRIKSMLAEKANLPVSIYIHIPFCQGKKCGFCDCLSVTMANSSPTGLFVEKLCKEIDAWARIPGLAQKPVSVLYFGGGTPNSLPDRDFENILQQLFARFQIGEHTQISVECPAKILDREKLGFLKSLKVTRLSIGIQTLEEPLRQRIGRETDAVEVLKKIHQAKKFGFTVCGDIIYGLPDQTVDGYVTSIKKLIESDIDGLSLYRFVVTPRNRDFVLHTFPHYQKDEIENYILFQVGHQLLTKAGYGKNHFIHFVKNDDNLYYRHLLRGEDLIAMGPTADGIIGSYRYRHPNLKQYLQAPHSSGSVFEGGILESKNAMKIKPATVEMMCGQLSTETIQKLDLYPLIEKWLRCHVVERRNGHGYRLTANGSWLVDQLLDHVDKTVNGRS